MWAGNHSLLGATAYNQKAKTKGTQPTPPQHKIMWWEGPKPLQIV